MILAVVIQLQSQQFWTWAGVISTLRGCGLDSREIMLPYTEGGRNFSFPRTSVLGPTKHRIQWVQWGFLMGWGGGPFAVSSTKVESEWRQHRIQWVQWAF